MTTILKQHHNVLERHSFCTRKLSKSDLIDLLRGGVEGGGTRFLVAATMMFGVAANSIKYGLYMNIIPQEGYEGTKNLCLWTGPKISGLGHKQCLCWTSPCEG